MKGRPGSSWWLLQHELRMFWFNLGRKRHQRTWWLPLLGLGWAGLHVVAYYLLRDMPAAPGRVVARIAMMATLLMIVLGTFMFSSGLKSSVDSLFERGDVDLLLSSPLPSRSIFTVRLAAITIGVASSYLLLAAPIVNVGLLIGHAGWLAVYPVLLAWATICCALAMLLTLFLVRVIGARRTRVVAQIISAIAGAMMFLLAQAQNILGLDLTRSLKAVAANGVASDSLFAPDSRLWLAGRALAGDAMPLLGLLTIAVALFWLTVHTTHGFFVRGVQQAVSTGRVRRKTGVLQGQFGRHLMEVVLRKEWRLIARDPHLLSQVLLQLFYLLPLAILVLRSEEQAAPGVAAGLTMLSGSLAASLTWIIVSAEEAPDLLQTSPAAARMIRLAKLGAAIMPPLLLMVLPLLWALAHHPVAGLLMCFTVVAATCAAALTGLWLGRPSSRGAFKSRGKANQIGAIVEIAGSAAWAWTGFILIRAASPGQSAYDARWAGISLALALLILLLAWGTRRRTA